MASLDSVLNDARALPLGERRKLLELLSTELRQDSAPKCRVVSPEALTDDRARRPDEVPVALIFPDGEFRSLLVQRGTTIERVLAEQGLTDCVAYVGRLPVDAGLPVTQPTNIEVRPAGGALEAELAGASPDNSRLLHWVRDPKNQPLPDWFEETSDPFGDADD